MPIKRHIVILDTETTGLRPDHNEMTQISAMALNSWDLSPHHAGKFNVWLKPQFPDRAEAGALRVARRAWDTANAEGVHPKMALEKLLAWLRSVNDEKHVGGRPYLVGHNVQFDIDFLNYWMMYYKIVETKKGLPWANTTINTAVLAMVLFEGDPEVRDLTLDSVAARFGIPRTGIDHDAREDVDITAQIFTRSMKFFRYAAPRFKIAPPPPPAATSKPSAGVMTKGG